MEGGEATQLNDPRLSALSQTPTWREWFVASLATFWSQYMALVLKNLRLARRNWKGTIGLLFAPIMVILFLLGTICLFFSPLRRAFFVFRHVRQLSPEEDTTKTHSEVFEFL